jgi:hypothetical protein
LARPSVVSFPLPFFKKQKFSNGTDTGNDGFWPKRVTSR